MNYKTHKDLEKAVEKFIQEYKDHPLLADTIVALRRAMFDLDTMLMSPGQKLVREINANNAGQEPSAFTPKHQ